jgi:V/A-type H+-transporting ATPase subunit F
MCFYLISDNHDTVTGMRLCGVEGIVLHDIESVKKKLEELLADSSIGIILITEKLAALDPSYISELRLSVQKPLIVEIPDRHGGSGAGAVLSKYLSDAVGIKVDS